MSELHEDPSFASITVHEEVVDLVVEVLLLERDEVLLLRLDRFIQFLYTSSVMISLEFVLSNLRLTVSEDLLPLSVQESPNLFAFRVSVSESRDLARDFRHGKQRFLRSIMTH